MLTAEDIDTIRQVLREELAAIGAITLPTEAVTLPAQMLKIRLAPDRLEELAQETADAQQEAMLIIPAGYTGCSSGEGAGGSRQAYYVREAAADAREKEIAVKRIVPKRKEKKENTPYFE